MKWKRILLGAVALFIGVNGYLVVKDDEGKIDRISYIKNWTEAEQKDMYDRLETVGVLDFIEEQTVYFDENAGMVKQFLVKKGDDVDVGTPLYTYEVERYESRNTQLDNEINRLNDEIKAIEKAIDKMEKVNIRQAQRDIVYSDQDGISLTFPADTASAEMMKEQYMVEKENELEQRKAQLTSVEAEKNELVSGEDTITVESPFYGKVTDLSLSLQNPLMTIEIPEFHVNGELTEEERMKVEEGMPAKISLLEKEVEAFQGSVSSVSDTPKNMTLKGNSVYPFHVTFDEDQELEDLLQGYHVNLEVTLASSLGATVIDDSLVDGDQVWKMTRTGWLIDQSIERGIHMDGYIEVMEDFKSDDWIAVASESKFRDQATFITPFKRNKAKWEEIWNNGPRKRSILIGLLGR